MSSRDNIATYGTMKGCYDMSANRTRKELDGKTIKYNRNKKY